MHHNYSTASLIPWKSSRTYILYISCSNIFRIALQHYHRLPTISVDYLAYLFAHTLASHLSQIPTTMTAATTPPLHVLRGILRHFKPTPSQTNTPAAATASSSPSAPSSSQSPPPSPPTSQPQSLQQHILLQYRTHRSLPPRSPKAHALRTLAYDYYILKKDLKERARLYELDAGAEDKLSPRELSRRAAARAGLQLPQLDAEG